MRCTDPWVPFQPQPCLTPRNGRRIGGDPVRHPEAGAAGLRAEERGCGRRGRDGLREAVLLEPGVGIFFSFFFFFAGGGGGGVRSEPFWVLASALFSVSCVSLAGGGALKIIGFHHLRIVTWAPMQHPRAPLSGTRKGGQIF